MQIKEFGSFEIFSQYKHSIGDIFGGDGAYSFLPYVREYASLSEEELVRIIRIAKEYDFKVLDLSNCALSNLPDELWELSNLEVLFLGNDDSGINENNFSSIPNDICKLTKLVALSICGLRKVKIPAELKKMPALTYLDCYSCFYDDIPTGLLNKRIKAIGINVHTEFQLKKICRIKGLEELHIANSPINTIPFEIGNLLQLKTLNINGTNVKELPDSMLQLKRLRYFDYSNTPLEKTVPLEMQSDAQTSIEIVRFICTKQKERGYYYFNEAKMIVVGQGDVGKSCLVDRLVNNHYENKESTEGIDVKTWSFSHSRKQYSLNIWDFGGQEIYHSTHQFFLTKRALYILVWDARSEAEYGRIDYWLKTICAFASDSPIIVVINKCDKTTTRINRIDYKEYKEKYSSIQGVYEVSCKDNINIRQLRNAIINQASSLPINRERWIKSWHEVKDILMKEKNQNGKQYITFDEYLSICSSRIIDREEAISLSKYLHDLGVILHYENDTLLRNIVILSPEWVTSAVYKILDSQETILRHRNGILKSGDLPNIWKDSSTYPPDKYIFILKIMEKFDLCYAINESTYLIAELLENTRLDIPEEWNLEDSLTIVYKYDFLPAGIITRFIVKIHANILKDNGQNMCWRKGAFLTEGLAYASVIMDDSISEKTITVRVSKNSLSDSIELLHVIRHTINNLNKSYTNLRVEEFVPCNCNRKCKHLFKYEVLCEARNKGINTIQCYDSFSYVNILDLLEGIQIMDQKENKKYGDIKIINAPHFNNMNNNDNSNTSSTISVIDIKESYQMIMALQGDISDLEEELSDIQGFNEIKVQLSQIKKDLERIESCKSTDEIVKSGKLTRIKRALVNLADPKSDERKALTTVKNAAMILSGIFEKYNALLDKFHIPTIPLC